MKPGHTARPGRRLVGAGAGLLGIILLGACGDDGEGEFVIPYGLQTETVAAGAHVSEIAFAPDGRIFFAEQFTGAIRIIDADGRVLPEPFAQLTVAEYLNLDWGLTGLALHPDFETNGYVYAFYTLPAGSGVPSSTRGRPPGEGRLPAFQQTQAPGPLLPPGATPLPMQPGVEGTEAPPERPVEQPLGKPVIVRFRDEGNRGVEETIISEDFPITPPEHPGFNGNGNIHFGPDGYLYVSVGNYDLAPGDPTVQDIGNPIGKLLRIDPETGEASPDNPYVDNPDADPRVFARGFREPFDFALHPESGVIYATDNTTVSCEELNVIRPGENYSWPDVGSFPYADCAAGPGADPIYNFSRPGMAPGDFLSFTEISGIDFAPGSRYPALADSLFVCESRLSDGADAPGALTRAVLAGPEFDQVAQTDVITVDCKGDVTTAPDGTVYYATPNEIRRLIPGASPGVPAGTAPGALSPPAR